MTMTIVYDPKPTIEEVDRNLRDVAEITLERYARDFDPAQLGGRSWAALPLEERRGMRAANELARRQNAAKRQAAKDEEQQRIDAQHQALIDAEIDAYKRGARMGWKGTEAQFEAAWPDMLRAWQISESQRAAAEQHAAVRARIGNAF
jgi:hypothetical protein